MSTHIDPTSPRIGLPSHLLILRLPIVVLLNDHLVFRRTSTRGLVAPLTQLGQLAQAPVGLDVLQLVQVLGCLA